MAATPRAAPVRPSSGLPPPLPLRLALVGLVTGSLLFMQAACSSPGHLSGPVVVGATRMAPWPQCRLVVA